jgi:hypothetical protein
MPSRNFGSSAGANDMITLSETKPPIEPRLNLVLAELIEKSADMGNAGRAARLEGVLSEAIALIERAAKAPAADLVRELAQCQRSLESLRAEAKANGETSEGAKGKLMKMVDALKNSEI